MSIILRGLIMYISCVLSFMFGQFDVALRGLFCFIIIDYVTGVISGFYLQELNSKRGLKGIIKKVFLVMVVAITTISDEIINAQGFARSTIIYFFIATEGLSILENCVKCGVPVPDWLVEKLEQVRSKSSSDKGLDK